ncbi:hypothetical protein FRUB_03082 [Fimbriiglobus ruber]|uniref:Uncharacterized protein n=2 Tax=Fimbriiglobus ruber TaxID=1908690 RepID=A0A225DQV9_9BACT|nr:hypothetical protein FRUB_03082 [Fimbriiglobus ruber]
MVELVGELMAKDPAARPPIGAVVDRLAQALAAPTPPAAAPTPPDLTAGANGPMVSPPDASAAPNPDADVTLLTAPPPADGDSESGDVSLVTADGPTNHGTEPSSPPGDVHLEVAQIDVEPMEPAADALPPVFGEGDWAAVPYQGVDPAAPAYSPQAFQPPPAYPAPTHGGWPAPDPAFNGTGPGYPGQEYAHAGYDPNAYEEPVEEDNSPPRSQRKKVEQGFKGSLWMWIGIGAGLQVLALILWLVFLSGGSSSSDSDQPPPPKKAKKVAK